MGGEKMGFLKRYRRNLHKAYAYRALRDVGYSTTSAKRLSNKPVTAFRLANKKAKKLGYKGRFK